MVVETTLLRWIVLLPLLGVLHNVVVASRGGKGVVPWVAPGVVGGSFVVAIVAVVQLFGLEEGAALVDPMFRWIDAGRVHIGASLRLDALSAVMILIVTGIGFLIHVYSTGYMDHEEDYGRYFAYLNLFMVAMTLLVLADNLVLFFVGWEGVGLCSYLLIGFWYTDDANASAGKKAFIVNRIGDAGFLLGALLLFWALGREGVFTLDFSVLRESAHLVPAGTATIICLLLFVGATGKSAQIPLYVWLPDAMAGPTPVSALIHAATMVTAGVYMVARMSFLYDMAPTALEVVAFTGAITAVFAASIGLVQNDIKKVLAYSTVSQLGYMFLAVGVGAYSAGIFHVMTHAFFKALLFLGSGSVIHAMGGEQDIRKMGGLRAAMPITYATFAIGCAAIAGVPLLAGFFSKDMILFHAFYGEHGNPVLWGLGILGAVMTAFYMFRLLFLTFWGECRADEHTRDHLHESPPSMTVPLVILAGLSVVGGWIGLPEIFLWGDRFGEILAPALGALDPSAAGHAAPAAAIAHAAAGHEGAHHAPLALELALMGASVLAAAIGIATAWVFYVRSPEIPGRLASRLSSLHELLLDKYRVDEAYGATFVRGTFGLGSGLWRFADTFVIDGIVNGVAAFVQLQSDVWRRVQTGNVQHYALTFLVGVLVLLGVILVP